jgi:type I restriction enzyme, S subunit
MSEWKEYSIGELVTFQRGHDLPREEMKEGIYPVAGSNSIIGYHNKFTTEGPGITIGRSGNIGNPQFYKVKFWAHNTTLYVKEFKNVNPVFFYYLLTVLDFSQLNSGSAVPSLNRNFIHPFKVRIPSSLPTQTAVAEILSSLDDKIELNNKINQELEALAQGLFKQWFIDFEFPNENGEPYKSSGGEMVDTELGEIPKGWEVKTFADVAHIIDCLHSKKPIIFNASTGYLFLQLSNIKDNGLLDLTQKFWISKEDYQKWISRIEVREGDFVITNVGRSGAVSRIGKGVKAAIGRNMTAIRLKDNFQFNGFFSVLILSDFMKKEITSKLDSGTILDALNVKNIPKLRFAFPIKLELPIEFEKIVRPIWDRMEMNIIENNSLIDTRDYLLPKLISGELEIND